MPLQSISLGADENDTIKGHYHDFGDGFYPHNSVKRWMNCNGWANDSKRIADRGDDFF
ncbi:MAG: hypothetical protein AAFY26_21190 [Cyanobacteria bacterium J06638_22]